MAIPASRPADPVHPVSALRLPPLLTRLGSAAVVSLALLGGAHLALRHSSAPPGFLHIDKVQNWRTWQDFCGSLIQSDPDTAVALLGDSVIIGKAPPGMKNVPVYLDEALQRIAPQHPPRIAMLAWPGQSLYERYFLADELVATGVRNVVFAFNLASASPLFRATTATELSGWLPVGRWPEAAALPLADLGLGIDTIALYGAGRALDVIRPWRALRRDQARMAALVDRLQTRLLTDPEGRARKAEAGQDQYAKQITARNYQLAFQGLDRGSAAIRMLEATLRIYRAAEIRVLLFVDPIDLQTLASLGFASDSPGLRLTLTTLASVSADHGVHFLDLHDLLPHEAFFDPLGHLGWTGDTNGTQQLAEAIAPHVSRMTAPH